MKLDMTYEDTWDTRTTRLTELGVDSYEAYLQTQHWIDSRSKAHKRPNYNKCEVCSSSDVQLHHSSYTWIGTKFELRNVNSFCPLHHKLIHEFAKETGVSVRLCTNIVRDPSSETSKCQILDVNKDFFRVFESNRHLLNIKQ